MKILLTSVSIALLAFSFSGCTKKADQKSQENDPDVIAPINTENNKSTGYSAYDLLNSSPYTSLKIEIQYMPGYQPDGTSVNNMLAFLNTTLNKTGGITLTQKEIPSGILKDYSLKEIGTIEQQNRTAYNAGNQMAIYMLVVDGNYAENGVLGVAYRNTSFALFGKKLHDNSGGIGQASRTKVVTTVLKHEFGHLLGLVDMGSPMTTNHVHPNYSAHCNNEDCLMYYATETADLFGILLTGNIPSLDNNCMADLKANGAK